MPVAYLVDAHDFIEGFVPEVFGDIAKNIGSGHYTRGFVVVEYVGYDHAGLPVGRKAVGVTRIQAILIQVRVWRVFGVGTIRVPETIVILEVY